MRTLVAFLIALATGQAAEPSKVSLFQARGLRNGNCYRELVTFSCEPECTISLFPTTVAELVLNVDNASQRQRKKPGRFFESRFLVRDDVKAKVSLLSLKPISLDEMALKMSQASGLLQPVKCR